MARAVKWTIPFKNLSNMDCRIDIYEEGYSDDPIILSPANADAPGCAASSPFTYEESNTEDLMEVVRTKTGYINLVELQQDALRELFPQTNTEHMVKVYRGTALIFVGFLQAQSFDNEYKPCPRIISIPVACALSVAYGIRFAPTSNPSYRTLASVLKEAVETIDAGIDKIIFPDYILSETERILSLRINTLAYCPFNDDYNIYVGSTETLYNPDLVSDFIENLCHCFGLTAHAVGSEIVFAKYDYNGNYNEYIVNTMDSDTPSFRAIASGATTIDLTSLQPKSDQSRETTILPVNKVEIEYDDKIDPSYSLPYNRTKAHTYGDNWVILTPSTDEITSEYFTFSSLPTTTSNNVACCATNGSDSTNGFNEMMMFSRVTSASELFTWKLYNVPKYANRGCKLMFSLLFVTPHEVGGRMYYDTTSAPAKSMGVRIKNGGKYFQNNGTWAAAPDVIYRNTGGTEGETNEWELTIWTAMNDITSPLEITFFAGNNSMQVGLLAMEDITLEPIQKGIEKYVANDNSNRDVFTNNNGSVKTTSLSQTFNVRRKSEKALVKSNGGFYSTVASNYGYMFATQYLLSYDTFIMPSIIHYLQKYIIGASSVKRRIVGFDFNLWDDIVTIKAQGSATLG